MPVKEVDTLWIDDDPEDTIDPQPRSFISANGLLAYTLPWTDDGARTGNVIGAVAPKAYYRVHYLNYFSDPIVEGWTGYRYQTLAEARKRRNTLTPPGTIWLGILERFVSGEGWKETA